MSLTSSGALHRTLSPGPVADGAAGLAAEPPRSLAALVARGGALTELAVEAETLSLILPLFGRASATTSGPHALLSERGAYGPVRLAGQSQARARGRIGLRLVSGRGERLVLTALDPAQRQPATLHLFGADGHLRHRTEIAAPDDLLILASVMAELGSQPLADVPPETDLATVQVSIPAIRRAQADWRGMDAVAHLDSLMLDGGPGRLATLRHLGGDLARPVPPERLLPFVGHLASVNLPFRRSVLRPGCVQSHIGAVELMPMRAGPMLLRSRASLFALDHAAVANCWLTQWQGQGGAAAVLELYDTQGFCLALLSSAGGDAAEDGLWNRLAGLLAGI